MKRILIAYTRFSKIERLGLVVLMSLLLIFFTIWQTMEYWLPVKTEDPAENRKMTLAYEAFRATHLSPADGSLPDNNGIVNIPVSLFAFDPNTLDSVGFLKLGLSNKVVKGLMNWRRHGKKFYKKEDLKPLYNLTPEDYARIEPYISIAITDPYNKAYTNSYEKLPPLPATLDINTTDSATLVRLNGIGPTLAHKIITRRTALGGFLKHEQLMEVYKFNDTIFSMLKEKLIIKQGTAKRINVNLATVEQLQGHPYIGEKTAKNIILYRNALKHFDNLQQLRQVPLMNEEIYRKIAPYLTVD